MWLDRFTYCLKNSSEIVFSRIWSKFRFIWTLKIFWSRGIPANPKIAYAVLTHERPEYLEACLLTLFKSDLTKYEIDIYLLDDGSSDPKVRAILEMYRTKTRAIKYFPHSTTNTAGEVINRAVKFMKLFETYDLYAWSDPDAIYSKNWLDNTLKAAIKTRNKGIRNRLGPFTSFNSNDVGHIIKRNIFVKLARSKIVVREQAGMLNMFATPSDLTIMGNFPEVLSDESKMCRRMRCRGLYFFSTYHSYIEHIGIYSNFSAQRVNNPVQMVTGLNLISGEWPEEIYKNSAFNDYRNSLNSNLAQGGMNF